MLRQMLFAILLALSSSSPARAETVVLGAAKDNTLYENAQGTLSNAVGDHLFAGNTRDQGVRRALIAFDVASAVPAGATITAVLLTLNMSRTVSGPHNVALHRLTSDWGEGDSNAPGVEGAGAPATTGDATWIHTFFNSVFWNTPGGDFVANASATTSVSFEGSYIWGSTTQMVADTQMWLDEPATNFGWILIGNEPGSRSAKRFDSKDNPTPGLQPQLTVQYEPSMPVTPMTWERVKSLYQE